MTIQGIDRSAWGGSHSMRQSIGGGRLRRSVYWRLTLLACAAVGLSPSMAKAITADWNAPVSGNWTDASMWTSNPNFPDLLTSGIDYDVDITASGSPFIITLDTSIVLVKSITLNSADVTVDLNGQNVNVGSGGVTLNNGVLDLNGALIVTPFLNGANTSNLIFNAGFLWLNSSDINIDVGGPLGDNVTIAGGMNLYIGEIGLNNYAVHVQDFSTLTLDGGTIETNQLVRQANGTFNFNFGSLRVNNGDLNMGSAGQLTSDLTVEWGRELTVSGVLSIDAGFTLTQDSGNLSFGSLDLSAGGSFVYNGGYLTITASDVVIQSGETLGDYFYLDWNRSLTVQNGHHLIVGDTSAGIVEIEGGSHTVDGNLYVARQAGAGTSYLNMGLNYGSSSFNINGNAYIGGDGVNDGDFAQVSITNSSNLTVNGLFHIHSTGSVHLGDYSILSVGQFFNNGVLTFGYYPSLILTDTAELIFDDSQPYSTATALGSNLVLDGYSGSNLRSLSTNNFLSIGHHGGSGSIELYNDAELIVGNVLTIGSGGSLTVDNSSLTVGDLNNSFGGTLNLNYVRLTFTGSQGVTLDPSYYQLGDSVTVDGGSLYGLHVSGGPLTVGNTGYGYLYVSVYDYYYGSSGVSADSMTIGAQAGSQGEVYLQYGYGSHNLNVANDLNVGVVDGSSGLLQLDNGGTARVGGNLNIGAPTSGSFNTTGTVTLDYGYLYVDGTLFIDEFGSFSSSNYSTLQVGSLSKAPGASLSINQTDLTIVNGDLTVAAGEIFGDYLVIDNYGSGQLLNLYLTNGNLNVGASYGEVLVNNYANLDVGGTTTIVDQGILTIDNGSYFTTGQLVVQPGGTFNWVDGYFHLTSSDLVLDTIVPSILGYDSLTIDDYGSYPVRRGLNVDQTLVVGDTGDGSLDIVTGYVYAGNLRIALGAGSNGQVTVGNGNNYAQLNVSGNISLGGDDVASGGANSASLVINTYASLYNYGGTIRIWDGSTVTLDGGTLLTQDIIKDDGTGTFNPGDFTFNSGSLYLYEGNLDIDSGKLLGNNVSIDPNKTLEVLSNYTNTKGITTVKNGATLSLDGGYFQTRVLVVESGGTFQYNSGNFQLLSGDLVIDSVTGILPSLTLTNYYDRVDANGGNVIIGDGNDGTVTLNGGTLEGQAVHMGRGGGTFSTTVGTGYDSAYLRATNGDMVVGGDDTNAGGTGTLLIQTYGRVESYYGVLRIWDGSSVNLSNGNLYVQNIVKDDGTGTFNPGDFTFNSGRLEIRNADVNLAVGEFLGDNLTLDSGKILYIRENDATGAFTVGNGATFLLNGGTLDTQKLVRDTGGTAGFTSGNLYIRNDNLVIAPDGALGASFTLLAGSNLTVQGSPMGIIILGDASGAGQYTQSGGSVTTNGLQVGNQTTGNSIFTLNSGNFYIYNTGVQVGGDANGSIGNGTINVNGGQFYAHYSGQPIRIWSTGTFNLTGGEVVTTNIQRDTGGIFNFTGGILSVSGSTVIIDAADGNYLGGSYASNTNSKYLYQSSYSYNLIVGNSTTGSALLNGGPSYNQGGRIQSLGGLILGNLAGSDGQLTVGDGSGAGLVYAYQGNFGEALVVGKAGAGSLTIQNNSYVYAPRTQIAKLTGSTGILSVASGSHLDTANGLIHIGGDGSNNGGSGELIALTGGTVGSSWHTNVMTLHAAGTLKLQGGVVYIGSINDQGGEVQFQSGTLRLNSGNLGTGAGEVLGSNVTIPVSSAITLANSNPALSIFTIGAASTLTVHGTLNTSALEIQDGGVLQGSGAINKGYFSNTLQVTNQGDLNPGASPGILTINGNYTQMATGALNIEINGTTVGTQYDRLHVAGNVVLAGDLNIDLNFFGLLTDQFTFLTYTGSLTGYFTNVNITAPGYALINDTDNKRIVLTNIPEPASLCILTLGALGLLTRRRRSA